MGALFALLALAVVPFLILGVAFKALFALILLPLRIVGGLFKAVLGLIGGLFGVVAGGFGLIFGLLAMLVVFVLLPLAPLLLLGGIVWLALKALSPAARPA